MTDTGARWKRHIDLPNFGEERTYWAVRYNSETRYVAKPSFDYDGQIKRWLKPLYAVRVRARSV